MDLLLLGHRGKGHLFWDAGESEFAVGLSDFKEFVCLCVNVSLPGCQADVCPAITAKFSSKKALP